MEKRHFSIIFAAIVSAVLALTSCSGFNDLTVNSFNITSMFPAADGFDVSLTVDVENDGREIEISGTDGRILAEGSPIASFTVEDVIVPARCSSSNTLKVHLRPESGMSILSFLKLRRLSADDFTLDVEARIKRGRLMGKRFKLEGIRASELIDKTI